MSPLGVYPVVVKLGHMLVLVLAFWEAQTLQLTVNKGSSLSTFSLVSGVTCLLDDSDCDWDETKSQSNLNLHFPVGKNVEHILKCLWNIRSSSFENSVHFHGLFLSFMFNFLSSLWVLGINPLLANKVFHPFCRLPLYLMDAFLCCTELSVSWCPICQLAALLLG